MIKFMMSIGILRLVALRRLQVSGSFPARWPTAVYNFLHSVTHVLRIPTLDPVRWGNTV